MVKLNMRLTENDEKNLDTLKKYYGLIENSEIVRFLLAKEVRNIDPNINWVGHH